MKVARVCGCLFALIAFSYPVFAALNPADVVVVYNSHANWNSGQLQSKAVADYYCLARGIPAANELGISWDGLGEQISPGDFVNYILSDQGSNPGLLSFLSSRSGFDENDPGSDPTKAIVLCYGIPIKAYGNERNGAVDASLSLLYSDVPWGKEPIGAEIPNPYCEYGSDPALRTRPADFEGFRRSSYNNVSVAAPEFTIVRMLDASHALAGGAYGILYRGEFVNESWVWTPIIDTAKQFIRIHVNDICVLDAQHAWVCTQLGSVIQTSDGGDTWTTVRMGSSGITNWTDDVKSVSFYNSQAGWVVGNTGDSRTQTFNWFVQKYSSGSWTSTWGNLPTSYEPKSVAATDSMIAWVSGTGGIYHTINGGSSWSVQYTGDTGDIWISGNEGWAIAVSGKVLHTADGGANWVELTTPTIPAGYAPYVDLAVYDSTHIALAYGTGRVWLYDGSSWIADDADSQNNKASATWSGNRIIAAIASTSAIRVGQGSPGSFTWSESLAVPAANWKLRYLVCRLDGYARPEFASDWTTVVIDGQNRTIPTDVKGIIDRAKSADDAGRAGLSDAKFVLDDAPNRGFPDSVLRRIAGDSHVKREADLGIFLTNETNVIGYANGGSYDSAADNFTTWWRPLHTWLPGALGVYLDVSTDGRTLRSPRYIYISRDTEAQNIEQGVLKVYLWVEANASYATHWVALRAADGSELARAYFDSTEQITRTTVNPTPQTYTVRVARINLSSVSWPTDNRTYMSIHFPTADPEYASEVMTSTYPGTEIASAYQGSGGITYAGGIGQCLSANLIREGCTAVTGNVDEPFGGNTALPDIILSHYATGRTWAESAYMGLPCLGWMEIAVGDPLMAPYKVYPAVSFAPPTPANGDRVKGSVSLEATASPDGAGSIERVEFWVRGGQINKLLCSDTQSPYECVWDSEALSGSNRIYPNGNYTIQAIAYESGDAAGIATASRSVVLDSTGVPTINISQPQSEGSVVSASTSIVAETDGSPTQVEFWLFGNGAPILVETDASNPYECSISPTVAEGVYALQAIAYYAAPAAASYTSRRSIVFINSVSAFASVAGISGQADNTPLAIANVPVVAGTSSTMDGAFYIEDSSRASGIRVETQNAITTGKTVTVFGTLHKSGTGITERYIQASQIWDMGTGTAPSALGMPNLQIGGQAPSGTAGVTGGVGLYNTGLLVRVWGKVTYVGSDYVYIDDASGLQDGNTLQGPIIVPLDGSAIPTTHPPVIGIRVYCGTLNKPGIGDHIAVTGISSTKQIGSNIVRCVRVRSQDDISYIDSYTRCTKIPYVNQQLYGHFLVDESTLIPLGSKVRLVSAFVQINYGTYFKANHTDYTGMWSLIQANTLLPSFSIVTVTGVSVDGGSNGDEIVADHIYLGGAAYGALSLSPEGAKNSTSLNAAGAAEGAPETPERGGGPFKPWPYPTAEEILASPAFQAEYNQLGNIGWALSQSDGSVLDLRAEAICGDWYDGRVIGLREWFEPVSHGPNLLLYLHEPIRFGNTYRNMATIDIIGGKLVTLDDGHRALVEPETVYVYTNSGGQCMFPITGLKHWASAGTSMITEEWPWKAKIAP